MDLISRQAAIDFLKKWIAYDDDGCQTLEVNPDTIFHGIEAIPSAEVEPVKRGKWIDDNQFHWYRASCSECGYKRVTDIKAEKWNGWKYCPNCGAKMEGVEE